MKLHIDHEADTLDITLNVPSDDPKNETVDWVDLLPGVSALIGTPHITRNVVDAEKFVQRHTVIYTLRIYRLSERNTGQDISTIVDQAWQLNTMRQELQLAAARHGQREPNLAAAIEHHTRTPEDRDHDAAMDALRERGTGCWKTTRMDLPRPTND